MVGYYFQILWAGQIKSTNYPSIWKFQKKFKNFVVFYVVVLCMRACRLASVLKKRLKPLGETNEINKLSEYLEVQKKIKNLLLLLL
jgi:predicted alpha/beta-fold hydrolase